MAQRCRARHYGIRPKGRQNLGCGWRASPRLRRDWGTRVGRHGTRHNSPRKRSCSGLSNKNKCIFYERYLPQVRSHNKLLPIATDATNRLLRILREDWHGLGTCRQFPLWTEITKSIADKLFACCSTGSIFGSAAPDVDLWAVNARPRLISSRKLKCSGRCYRRRHYAVGARRSPLRSLDCRHHYICWRRIQRGQLGRELSYGPSANHFPALAYLYVIVKSRLAWRGETAVPPVFEGGYLPPLQVLLLSTPNLWFCKSEATRRKHVPIWRITSRYWVKAGIQNFEWRLQWKTKP